MFQSARLKLTGWYLLIIMLVSLSFTAVIYSLLTREVDRFVLNQRQRMERRAPEAPLTMPYLIDESAVQELKQRLFWRLVSVNVVILILAGGLGYFLAGQTLEPIQKMVEEQDRFITDSSHELRTPLASLKSNLEVTLRDPNLKLSEAKEVMRESLEDVERLSGLTRRLLQLAHRPAGQLAEPPLIEKQTLKKTVTTAIKHVSGLAKEKQIKITNKASNAVVALAHEQLTEVLVILLDNAIKYSDPQTSVTVSTHIKRRRVVIEVADQGIGISASELPHVFDRFYRADCARCSTTVSGSGLGLAIARQTVTSLGGKITVESQEEQGSTFIVTVAV